MNNEIEKFPEYYKEILDETNTMGFNQLSNSREGSFLAALCASKIGGKFLELGTGTGLCTSWMLHGMCGSSTLLTVDNDAKLVEIAKKYLDSDNRIEFVVSDGEDVIEGLLNSSIDLIFADTWPGKYNHLDETLRLLKVGGVYVIDDMLPQDNWPEGHAEKASNLVSKLTTMEGFLVTKLCWSTGVMVCTKTA